MESANQISLLQEKISELNKTLREVDSRPTVLLYENTKPLGILDEAEESSVKKKETKSHSQYQSPNELTDRSSSRAAHGEETVAFGSSSTHQEGTLREIVDLGQGEGAVGFIGQMSEISWMYSVYEHLKLIRREDRQAFQVAFTQQSLHAGDLNYFKDESDLLSINEDHVQAWWLPSTNSAIVLSEACFHSIHHAFRFLDKRSFFQAFFKFPRGKTILSWTERRWLATANMIWAIGAKWLQMVKLDRSSEAHLMYYARARALGLDHRMLLGHPTIENLEAIGLLAFYLFVNGSISR